MRKVVIVITVLACVLLIVAPASSRMLAGIIRTTVDTNFMVGNMQLPAGNYTFALDTATSRLYIHNVNTVETVSVFTRDIVDNATPTGNKLVFREDGNKRVLHQVWSEQAGHVHDIVHGTEVKELARK